MTAYDINQRLRSMCSHEEIYIPEYTYGSLRIDGIAINLHSRKIRGFEIKVSKQDFKNDKKWQLYGKFCSTLSIACPVGLIQPEEVDKPFGLLWFGEQPSSGYLDGFAKWKKRPQVLANTNAYNWLFTYLRVIEREFPRLYYENADLRGQLKEYTK